MTFSPSNQRQFITIISASMPTRCTVQRDHMAGGWSPQRWPCAQYVPSGYLTRARDHGATRRTGRMSFAVITRSKPGSAAACTVSRAWSRCCCVIRQWINVSLSRSRGHIPLHHNHRVTLRLFREGSFIVVDVMFGLFHVHLIHWLDNWHLFR